MIDSWKLDKLVKQKYKSNKQFMHDLNNCGVDVKEDAIKKWRQGISIPKSKDMLNIAKCLGVDVFELYIDGHVERNKLLKHSPSNDTVDIPFYEDAIAGAGEAFYPEYLEESSKITISRQFLNGINPKYLMFFRIVGDSMEPTIRVNDWVLIELVADREFKKVSGIYLCDIDGTIQVKRLEFRGAKGIDIISDNPLYENKNTIKDNIELKVVGKLFMHMKHYGSLAIEENGNG